MLVYSLTSRQIRSLYARSIVAFAISVPIVFVLVLVARLTLNHVVPPAAQGDYFRRSILGAMVGCGVGILLSLKGTMNRVLEEKTTGLYSRFSQNELLRLSLLGALPIGIGGALLPTVPPELPARMILGAFWGFYVAAGVLVFTWLIERESISDARLYIVTVEIELLFFMLIFIFGSLFGTHVNLNKIFEGPELIIPASVVCIVTYLVAYVCSSWARE